MSWFRTHFGLDGVDTAIHAAVTVCGFVMVTTALNYPWGIALGAKLIAMSLVVFGWRRHRALKRMAAEAEIGLTSGQVDAGRWAEMEQRLADLEANQARVAELEERLDFTERLLASPERDRPLIGDRARG
jgi:hypothetical protein